MSGHGGGGGGASGIIAIIAIVVFVVALIVAFTLFPKSAKNQLQFGTKSATSTASGLPIAGAPRPSAGKAPSPGTKLGNTENPTTRSSSTFFTPAAAPVSLPRPKPITSTPSAPSTPTSSRPAISDSEIPAGFTRSQLSPYFHQVRLGSVYPGGSGYAGQISLYAYNVPEKTTVNVSSWRIQGLRGASFVPRAVPVYEANGLASEADIYLRNRDTLYLYLGGSSAIGKNFRLNKCMGYLPNASEFNPYLPRECPFPDRSEYSNFTGQCQNYISSLGTCGIPNFNDVRAPQGDYACREYLQKNFGYPNCVERYRGDANFIKSEVRAWIGGGFLDQYHDKVKLYDTKGLLVDTYEY